MDTKDLEAGHAITCPLLVIVGGRSHTSKFYRYEEAWARYATNLVRCTALPCGHYPAEQAPDETYRELRAFFGV
jgi:haloacetate dehalogenase